MSQNERLLDYLKIHGHITPLQAWNLLGIYRLSARILDLRQAGHKIKTDRLTVVNQFNEQCVVAQYIYTSE